ncbi:MAG: hypothetical protein AAF830_13375 [Pseudomonadota bacterium]
MKTSILLAGVTAVALTSVAHAGGAYIQLHGGVSQPTEEIPFGEENFLGQVTEQRFDGDGEMGFTGGGLLGAYILPFIALEGEFTMRTEPMEDISVGNVEAAVQEDLTTYAAMVNGVLRPSIPLLPDPYVGIGIGYLQPSLDLPSGENPEGRVAYQMKAGVSMGLLPGFGSLGLEASYIATDDLGFTEQLAEVTDEEFSYGGLTGLLTYRLGF